MPCVGSCGRAVAALVAAVALLALTGCGGGPAGDGSSASGENPAGPGSVTRGAMVPPSSAFPAVVTRLVDGDTFHARRADGREVTVRLIGIDSPETKRPGTPVQCYGPEASALLASLLPVGGGLTAAFEAGRSQDRYGRDLWDVWLPDGRFVNAEMVSAGAAWARAYPPTTDFAVPLAAEMSRARAAGRGLWSACPAPCPPGSPAPLPPARSVDPSHGSTDHLRAPVTLSAVR